MSESLLKLTITIHGHCHSIAQYLMLSLRMTQYKVSREFFKFLLEHPDQNNNTNLYSPMLVRCQSIIHQEGVGVLCRLSSVLTFVLINHEAWTHKCQSIV